MSASTAGGGQWPRRPRSTRRLGVAAGVWLATAGAALLAQPDCDEAQDAWIEGRLSTAYVLNPELNPTGLSIDVGECVVTLRGSVDSAIDRRLVVRIAEGVDGVRDVVDELEVTMAAVGADERALAEATRTFGDWVRDATTTALVQRRIAENRNITSDDISVETKDRVVVLRGRVPSTGDRTMAELVARNVDDVEAVRNLLDIAD